jgi:hypothetical protein
MKSVSSGAALFPCDSHVTATVSTALICGRNWIVTVGALACAERQIAQGAEFCATEASECACMASTPVISRARNTQIKATARISLPVSSCLLTGGFMQVRQQTQARERDAAMKFPQTRSHQYSSRASGNSGKGTVNCMTRAAVLAWKGIERRFANYPFGAGPKGS